MSYAAARNGDTPFGIALYNAGGVLANLLLTVIASVIMFMPSAHHSLVTTVFLLCIIISGLYLIVMNGIPNKLAGLPNDGLNMLNLHKDEFPRWCFCAPCASSDILCRTTHHGLRP